MNDYLVNEKIHFSQVLLIDETGKKVGVFPSNVALEKAYEKNLDLVCMNAKSRPAVCKIIDFSKFKYEQKIKEKEAKKKQVKIDIKEIQLRPSIAEHDLEVKAKKAREELLKGNQINIVLSFKGREISHPELGFNTINKFIDLLSDCSIVFKKPTLDNRKILAILKRK